MIVERIDPSNPEANERQVRLHQDRYDFAIRMMLHQKNTLDIGCGTGYGTQGLAEGSIFTIGVDYSKEALKIAKQNFNSENIMYIKDDVEKFWTPYTIHNLVGLEILEHLNHPEIPLINALELGVQRAILSIPLNEKLGDNPFHKTVWTVDGFKNMVESVGYKYIGRSFEQADNWTGAFSSYVG